MEAAEQPVATRKVTNNDLMDMLSSLVDRVEKLEQHQYEPTGPTRLPTAKSTADLLSGMKRGEQRAGSEYFGPRGRRQRFLPDDVVEVTGDKAKELHTGFKIDADTPIYGVVKSLMYHKRKSGEPKYKVDFGRGIREDGCMESELQLVQRG